MLVTGTNIIFHNRTTFSKALTLASQLLSDPVRVIEFRSLSPEEAGRLMAILVNDFGIVYVTSLTRDGCSGCAEQKPLYQELARKMDEKHPGLVRFANVHIRYQPDDPKESWDAKRVFEHVAYPTYMVHVKSHLGPLEVYRAVYPSMEELEKQTREALELAEYYKTEASKL